MRLFIQIRDGQPYEHPIMFDNFVQAFPDVDINNLPPEFANFERVREPRECGPLQVEELSYQWVGDIVKDVWTVRDLVGEERETRIQEQTVFINGVLEKKKQDATELISVSVIDEEKIMWQNYLDALNQVVIENPFFVAFPFKPIKKQDGTWMTTHNAGTEPDVIG